MQEKQLIKSNHVKAANKVLIKGERVMFVPVKDGVRLFSLDQKEIKIAEQEEVKLSEAVKCGL